MFTGSIIVTNKLVLALGAGKKTHRFMSLFLLRKKQILLLLLFFAIASNSFAQNYALDFDGRNDGSVSSFIR